MKLKIEGGKISASAAAALGRHAEALYETAGATRIGVVVLARIGAKVPDPAFEIEPEVSLRVHRLEIASPEQEDALRQALQALAMHRTAQGTLDEEGIALSPQTLAAVADHIDRAEAARLRVGVQHWAAEARRSLRTDGLTLDEARHELDAIATGLEQLILLAVEQP